MIVLSYRFWEQVFRLIEFLRLFLEVTIALETVRPKASRIFGYFQYLLQQTAFTISLLIKTIKELIGKRFASVYKPIMGVAYICDPLA
jgi:hypothetical protein